MENLDDQPLMLRKRIIVVVQYLAQSPLSMKPSSAFREYLLLNGPVQRTLKEITNCETYFDNKPHLDYTKFKRNIFCGNTMSSNICWSLNCGKYVERSTLPILFTAHPQMEAQTN